jgi:hypothetical protein
LPVWMKSSLRKQAPKEKKQFRILIVYFWRPDRSTCARGGATPNAVGYSND